MNGQLKYKDFNFNIKNEIIRLVKLNTFKYISV